MPSFLIDGREAGPKRSTELDVDAFETCLDDPKAMGQVRYDIGLGNKADLSGTPTFLVNGVLGRWGVPAAGAGRDHQADSRARRGVNGFVSALVLEAGRD